MAENTIDTLSLEINSDAGQAVEGIDKLANSLFNLKKGMFGFNKKGFGNLPEELRNLNSALMGFDAGKILSFSTAIKGLSESIRTLSGIGNLITPATKNLEKISKLDFSKLKIGGDFSGLGSLSSGINDFALAATSLGKIQPKEINRTVTAFEKLSKINLSGIANSFQSLNGIDVTAFKDLGTALQGFISSLSGVEKVHANVAKTVNSLSSLVASAGNIPLVSTELPRLKNELSDFIKTMSAAPSVQPGTVSIVSALAQISNAGTKAEKVSAALPRVTVNVKQFIEELSKAPAVDSGIVRTVESLGKLVDVGGRAGTAANKLQGQVNSLSVSMGKLRGGTSGAVGGLKSFAGQILSVLGISGGIYTLVRGLKTAISTGSDFIEVENVAVAGFSPLINKINQFAKTSIESFGMSELAAKSTAGVYAVMSRSMGLTLDSATDMSIELTKLTGDLASFYNVSQDVAATSLKSIFTGETETLKKFGIVMTESNLKLFALSQGIIKSYSAMSQAEKVMLRYNFVMHSAGAVMGDFARTASGSWANQIRILSQSFQQLAGIVGTGLMAALLPIIKVINQIMAKIIQLGTVISNFLGKLFGLKKAATGTSAGVSEIATAAGAVGDNMDAAASGISDAGGAAKKAGKEMNKFVAAWHEVNNMSSENDSGGGGGAGGGTGTSGLSFPENYSLEIEVEDQVSPVLEKIKKRFIELRKLFLNGFEIGLGDVNVFNSIKNNLQSIRDSLFDIFTDKKVISAFNRMLDTLAFDAGRITGAFISVGATVIDNLTGGMARYLDSAKERIKGYLINIFDLTGEISTIQANFVVAMAQIFFVFRSDTAKQLTADIISIFADSFMGAAQLAGKFIRDILDMFLTPFTENADKIKEAIENTLVPIEEVFGTLADSVQETFARMNQMYDEHLAPLFQSIRDGFSEIVGTFIDGYNEYLAPVLTETGNKFREMWTDHIQPVISKSIDIIGTAGDAVKAFWENILQPFLNWFSENIFPVIAPIVEGLGTAFTETFGLIGDVIGGFLDTLKEVLDFLTKVFQGDWDGAWNTIKSSFERSINSFPSTIEKVRDVVLKIAKEISDGILESVQKLDELGGLETGLAGKLARKFKGGRSYSGMETQSAVPMPASEGMARSVSFLGDNIGSPTMSLALGNVAEWAGSFPTKMASNFSRFENLQLDTSIPAIDYKPNNRSSDVSRMQSNLQMELDARAAQQEFEIRQLRDSVEQNTRILEKLLAQGIILDNNEFTSRYQKAASAYGKRTGKELGLYR